MSTPHGNASQDRRPLPSALRSCRLTTALCCFDPASQMLSGKVCRCCNKGAIFLSCTGFVLASLTLFYCLISYIKLCQPLPGVTRSTKFDIPLIGQHYNLTQPQEEGNTASRAKCTGCRVHLQQPGLLGWQWWEQPAIPVRPGLRGFLGSRAFNAKMGKRLIIDKKLSSKWLN